MLEGIAVLPSVHRSDYDEFKSPSFNNLSSLFVLTFLNNWFADRGSAISLTRTIDQYSHSGETRKTLQTPFGRFQENDLIFASYILTLHSDSSSVGLRRPNFQTIGPYFFFTGNNIVPVYHARKKQSFATQTSQHFEITGSDVPLSRHENGLCHKICHKF